MPLPEFPDPSPAPITRVSPSLANDLHACHLRVAFGRDEEFKHWRRPNTYSVLGAAAHSVTEAAFKRTDWGDDSARPDALEAAWEVATTTGAAKLAAAWSPAIPPPATEWPGYQLTKVRTLRRADRVIASRKAGGSAPAAGTGIEVMLEDPGSILFGRVDRLDRHGSTVRVVDLKTGLKQGAPSEDQTRQLLLYAVLVQRTSGEWPAEIAIENASGEQAAIPLDPAAAENALTDVLSAVAEFNRRAQEGSSATTARPSAETCRWCAYRPSCRAYWKELRSDWGHRSLLGEITDTGIAELGAYADLRIVSPSDSTSVTVHLASIPEPIEPGSTWIAAVDLRGFPDQQPMHVRWSSRVRSW